MAGLTDSYSRLDEIDPELFRRIILGGESTETTSNEEANGIMAPYEPVGIEPEEPKQGFLSGVVNWMRGNTDDPERLADAIVPQTIDLGPDLSNWENMPELKTIILPPPPPVSVTPITPGSTNLALYGDRLGKGTITSSTPASYTDAPADTLMTRPDGTPRSTQELEQLASDALPNIQVAAEAGLMTRPVQDVDTFKIPEFKSYETAEEMPDLEILARTIEAEASGESFEGKVAVGSVIANRVASGSYGGSGGIKGVILKRGQFSPWNSYTGYAKGEQGKDMLNLKASEESYKAANDILTGNYTDKTGGASHYVNTKVSTPDWLPDMKGRKKGTVTIGNHLFGNADNEKIYDGKSGLAELYSETTDQPLVAQTPTVKEIQSIIDTPADGQFGPASRNKALAYLKAKNVSAPEGVTDQELMTLVKGDSPLHILKATRADYEPSAEMNNISIDFNSFKGAKGTEVIIPDNASPETRAAAEAFNQMVVDFAAKYGYKGYKNRGVRTKSENKRGISNTVHVEPFFQQDSAMEKIVHENMEEFAKIYYKAFSKLPARLVVPHGTTNKKGVMDKGANSTTFGNELNFGNKIIDILQAGN